MFRELLHYIAQTFIPTKVVNVKEEYQKWNDIEARMVEPDNPFKKVAFNWVLGKVRAFRDEFEQLSRLRITYVGMIKGDDEPTMGPVEHETTQPD